MQTPWFFATTPAPSRTPATPAARLSLWSRLAAGYVAWAERSNRALHAYPHL